MKSKIRAYNSLIRKESGIQLKQLRVLVELEQNRKQQQATLTLHENDLQQYRQQVRLGREQGDLIDPAADRYMHQQMLCLKQDMEQEQQQLTQVADQSKQQKHRVVQSQHRIRVLERRQQDLEREVQYAELRVEYKETDELMVSRSGVKDDGYDN